MNDFTTRPDIRGTFGTVASTHWIASAVGMSILEKGGNAFDAAVATALVLQVVEPHLNGPGGDLPAIVHFAETSETRVLCAQGVAPKAATMDHYRQHFGDGLIPGSGLLATVVPGAFDGWMLMLRDHGSLELADVMEPAIGYARDGHPILPRVANTIEELSGFFRDEWPTSAATWLPGGKAPQAWSLFRNPDLASTYQRIVDEAKADTREARIDAARKSWSQGFVADAICDYLADASVMDVSGKPHSAVLSREDLAEWQASWEAPLSIDYHGWTVHKTQSWSQGPVLLQGLQILKHFDLAAMDPMGADFIHTVIEAMKLAYADREAYYGDPEFFDIPMNALLSEDYAAERARLIGDSASLEQRPGRLPGLGHLADDAVVRAATDFNAARGVSAGEPTMAHLTERRGDTVHLDVIDRWGNMVSATPSGGWLQSSPVIPGLGFALNSRAQMFWLRDDLPTSLRPGARPRTTLTPSMAEKDGIRVAFGTPGGDQQDQWQLIWFLRYVHHGLSMQQCMDAPLFHSNHFQSSFYPRDANPGDLMLEPNFDESVIADLRRRGHSVTVAEPWSIGRLTAARRDPDGMLTAAATPRLMQAYAIGR
ncbi:gamma-glutamyltransferase family protein [Paracoccus saliphilus]|uniref:Gamma-glutamyltransferase family protein n=1 Tax=Paracoccus saliphilus TaxID=405559 RepID=A0AA45W0P1_9RHOB|nr:gamma-glutamyltransferase family protein [Paracoccus saliphilus]WCR03257.1 gamma-glutamyltransferase family protein [Paracoccus saliphilus]SIS50336.1 gamma-glutamyltranspeptidase / glutathione hydrolase [Paracoccus saliphilus]